MKIFLRILAYGGMVLVLIAHSLSFGWPKNLAALGVALAVVAIVEAIAKYGK